MKSGQISWCTRCGHKISYSSVTHKWHFYANTSTSNKIPCPNGAHVSLAEQALQDLVEVVYS